MRRDHELVWICPSFMRDGDGFTSPNEFCATVSETLPAAEGIFAGVAIRKRVPAFHGLHGDAIGELKSAAQQRPLQRRLRSGEQFRIAGDICADGLHVVLEALNFFHRAEAENGNRGHASAARLWESEAAVEPTWVIKKRNPFEADEDG